MSTLLLIDDDPALLEVVSLALEDAGHQVLCAKDGLEALRMHEQSRPGLIVSDVNMPRLDGFALCRKLRQAGDFTPLILLTSRDNEVDEALGLELGADDYISKPFSTRILVARITALLRRDELRRGGQARQSRFVQGALELDPERLECRYGGLLVQVTVTEFRLIEALARRPGVLFTRDQLLRQIRDDDCIVVDRIIDTYVRRLRRKLEAVSPSFSEIETVIGMGYRWRDG
ncbi:response regulator transcription factor [Hyalangium sp.]|uniref:response regulator transcription factor n=1 Tax=Hyalangium sp. TaxID=2028555 RepID=UPI002D3CD8DE|nr:response regulator transcription factor [Hyalangium sp.]HYI02309.1 response regulator transcription factor [Hyalangium sp.]